MGGVAVDVVLESSKLEDEDRVDAAVESSGVSSRRIRPGMADVVLLVSSSDEWVKWEDWLTVSLSVEWMERWREW